MTYKEELTQAMHYLGRQDKSIFLGQGVEVSGTFMSATLDSVPLEKRLEMPVSESFQMQFTLGLAIGGYIPISLFPRQNFLLLGLADLVNVIDKMSILSEWEYNPHIIIRTAKGTTRPIWPGIQHSGEYSEQIEQMLDNVEVIELEDKNQILSVYRKCYKEPGIYIINEYGDLYEI